MISIDQLLETLGNPEGLFKSLTGLHLENQNGEPNYVLRSGGSVATFRVCSKSVPANCLARCEMQNNGVCEPVNALIICSGSVLPI